jgi:hypothetical protein
MLTGTPSRAEGCSCPSRTTTCRFSACSKRTHFSCRIGARGLPQIGISVFIRNQCVPRGAGASAIRFRRGVGASATGFRKGGLPENPLTWLEAVVWDVPAPETPWSDVTENKGFDACERSGPCGAGTPLDTTHLARSSDLYPRRSARSFPLKKGKGPEFVCSPFGLDSPNASIGLLVVRSALGTHPEPEGRTQSIRSFPLLQGKGPSGATGIEV